MILYCAVLYTVLYSVMQSAVLYCPLLDQCGIVLTVSLRISAIWTCLFPAHGVQPRLLDALREHG